MGTHCLQITLSPTFLSFSHDFLPHTLPFANTHVAEEAREIRNSWNTRITENLASEI